MPVKRTRAERASTSTKVRSSKNRTKTRETDVSLSIKPEFARLLSTREKNHEYRNYKLKNTVERLWLYETAPVSAITYIALIGQAHVPGEVQDPSGTGNDDFDAKKTMKYGYPVTGLYRLKNPVVSAMMKEKYGVCPPRGFLYAPTALTKDFPLSEQEVLF